MTDTATDPREDMTTAQLPAPKQATVPETPPVGERPPVRLTRVQSFGLALGSLLLVYGLGLVVTLAGGAVINVLDPTRHVDSFAAFHRQWVVGVLLGIAVLWLLPPHPWAKRVVASASEEEPAQAGRTEGGGGEAFAVHSAAPRSGAVPRPGGE
jgi:hypothetical protein